MAVLFCYGAKGIEKATKVGGVIQGSQGVLKIHVTPNTSRAEITCTMALVTRTTILDPKSTERSEKWRSN
jgi:hypothetical protein